MHHVDFGATVTAYRIITFDLADLVVALFASAMFVFIGVLLAFLRKVIIVVKNPWIGTK